MNDKSGSAVRDVVKAFNKAEKETEEYHQKFDVLPVEAREFVRSELKAIADVLRRDYGLSVPEIRRFLHDVLEVTI